MPSVTYNFIPGQQVYVIDDATVVFGTVSQVDITIDATATTTSYWILIDGDTIATQYDEQYVFANCRATSGRQDAVYLEELGGSPSEVAISGSPLPGNGSPLTLTADVTVDGGSPIILTHLVVGGETYADLIVEINSQLGAAATATLYQNNIRITSATTGTSSSVVIGSGSPLDEEYFKYLNDFTGLAASVDGLAAGAIETLSDQLCTG